MSLIRSGEEDYFLLFSFSEHVAGCCWMTTLEIVTTSHEVHFFEHDQRSWRRGHWTNTWGSNGMGMGMGNEYSYQYRYIHVAGT